MKKTRAIVITGNGTNCEVEAAHACRLGGFDEAVIAHIAEILSGEVRLDDFHFLNLTGGFLDGDDLGSAKAQANRLKHAAVSGTGEKLVEQFTRFIARWQTDPRCLQRLPADGQNGDAPRLRRQLPAPRPPP